MSVIRLRHPLAGSTLYGLRLELTPNAPAERRAASRVRSRRLLGRLASSDVQTQGGEGIAIVGPEWLSHFVELRADLRLCLWGQTAQDRRDRTRHLRQEPPVRVEARESPSERHVRDVERDESSPGEQLTDTLRV